MSLPCDGWKNKAGTSDRTCTCGSWKQHWINYFDKEWPCVCAVKGCSNEATVGAHIYNSEVEGEKIAPMCASCNKKTGEFTLKGNTFLAPANKAESCG